MNEFRKNLTDSVGMRVFIYLIALLVCLLIGSCFAYFFKGEDVNILKINLLISSVMMFVFPPLILYGITRNRPMKALGFRKPNDGWLLLIGFVLMFVSLPLTNLLSSWNQGLKLPEELLQWEESAGVVTDRMLKVDTVWGLLTNLLVIALIPAIGEELTFRGVIQQALVKWTKNPHVGIALSAAIFSFIHFQFLGFFPRLFLGLLIGYLFYYSDSLWTCILMHFVNNGSAVVVAYLDHKGLIEVDMEHFGATDNVWLLIFSALFTLGLLFCCNLINKKYGRQQRDYTYRTR